MGCAKATRQVALVCNEVTGSHFHLYRERDRQTDEETDGKGVHKRDTEEDRDRESCTEDGKRPDKAHVQQLEPCV